MSVLSSQRNRLLFLANELESRHFNMNEYANAMRHAADTIWELRNKLAGTVDQGERIAELEVENAKLRDTTYAWRTVDRLSCENAKLRELVRDMFEEIEAGGFDPMVERHGKSTVYYEEDPSWRVGIRERIRELRIEGD